METKHAIEDSDDARLKVLLRDYQPGDGPATGRLVGLLWPRISSYAASHKGWRHGWTRECFLTRMAERLPMICAAYRERGCRFSTWFFSVMRKEWSKAALMARRVPADLKACPELFPDPVRPERDEADGVLLRGLAPVERCVVAIRYPELMTEKRSREIVALGLADPERARRIRERQEELRLESGLRAGRRQERLDRLHARILRFGQYRSDRSPRRLAVLTASVERTARALRREFAAMSFAEMARLLGRPRGSLAAVMYRVRKKLRRSYVRCRRRVSWRVS